MMKKILAVMMLLMMSMCAEGVMLFEIPGRNTAADNASTFELNDGLSVEFCGIVRDLDAEGDIRECVFTIFLVTARDDMQLSVSSDTVYSVLGRKYPDYLGASVAGNSASSEIIGDYPTPVWFVHRVPVSHGELPKFSRMQFMFNGQSVELRGKSSEKWEDWKKDTAGKNEQLALWVESYSNLSLMYPAKYDADNLRGSQVFRGHHYKAFTNERKTWYEAEAACRNIGGHLAVISPTDREKDKFLDFIYGLFGLYKGTANYTYWVGRAGNLCQCVSFVITLNRGTHTRLRSELMTGIQANTVTDGYICEWDY